MPPIDFALLVGSVVSLVAVFAARLGSRLGLPALLLFLFLGMAMGNSGLGYAFNDADLAHGLGFAALVLILVEGGFTTKWANIRPAIGAAGLLATLGIGVSIGLMTLFGHYVLLLPWAVALLLGAVTAPTDSAAVFAVLRGVPLPSRVRAVLEAESGLNDAPTVLLVGAASQLALGHAPQGGTWGLAALVAGELAGGVLLGIVLGLAGVAVLRRIALPSSGLYPLAAMAWAVATYGAGVGLHVSGFAAVYVCAVVLGNGKLPHRHATRSFAEGIGWIAQIGLFVMLGLLANPGRISQHAVWSGILAGLFLTFVARPASVFSSLSWFRISLKEQLFISWAGLRGAVPIILATVPMSARVPNADLLFDIVLVFVIVFTSLQGPTLPWVGRKLGLADPNAARDVDIEAAPLDKIAADLLQIRIPDGSLLSGVQVRELRMPRNAVVSLIIRGERSFAPHGDTRLYIGDELLIVTPEHHRAEVERRMTEIGRGGRLARWNDVRA
ncbi:potassium/proton antiporter [Luteococcus sp. H138]|uniref:potassium/proton antiporter n=1 Tax=unclassified Luteococcus TaxID=2639923 RepID=UPI00313EA322